MDSSPKLNELAPLSSIEQFHIHDSNSRYPNKIGCRLLIAGSIDPKIARTACHWLAARHPIIRCRPQKSRRKWIWMEDEELYATDSKSFQRSESIHALDQPQSSGPADQIGQFPWFSVEYLDQPPQAPPDFLTNYESLAIHDWLMMPRMILRKWGLSGEHAAVKSAVSGSASDPSDGLPAASMSEVWFIVHHAWCDGGGGIAIANDWIEIYQNLISGKDPEQGMVKVDQQRFSRRNELGLTRWSYLKRLPFQVVGLYGAGKFIFRRTAQLSSSLSDGLPHLDGEPATYVPQLCSRWVESETLAQLDRADRRVGQNMNARLLAEWFGVLELFLQQQFISKLDESRIYRQPWVRVIVPINIREIADRRLSAANRSSLVQIDRRGLSCPASNSDVESIYRELGIIIEWKLDRLFLIAMRLMGAVPGLLARVARKDKHRGLSVFTNLGTPFRRWEKRGKRNIQSVDLVEIDFVAPLRRGTPFNLTLARSLGKMRLSLHYDPLFLSQSQANWLMDNFLSRLQMVADQIR